MAEEARLRWLCRRGMRELDILVTAYLDRAYPSADAEMREAFERLLELQDPEIHAYLLGRDAPTDGALADVVAEIRALAAR